MALCDLLDQFTSQYETASNTVDLLAVVNERIPVNVVGFYIKLSYTGVRKKTERCE